jgi:hypothetical protein
LFADLNGGDYTNCDKTKVIVRGDGKNGNDTAVVGATTTLYGEETRFAQVRMLDAFSTNIPEI